MLTLLMGWKADKLAGSTAEVGATWLLAVHSSDSHAEWHDVELALDACDAASEKTEEVEEEADEESVAAYG